MSLDVRVPDGGWGWAVVGGTAIINVFNQSLLSLFGLVFGPKLQGIAGTTGVTTVMSLNCTITNFSGLLISPLSKLFSTKQIAQIGVVLVAAGLALSTYTKNYIKVTFGYGVLTGLGLGLIASSTFLIINSYFEKNKSQAVGLAMAGTSIGQMGMPPIVALLVEHYGYDGTILILCGLSLHGLIGAMFFDPVSEHMVPKNSPKSNSLREWFCCARKEKKRQGVITNNNVEEGDEFDDKNSLDKRTAMKNSVVNEMLNEIETVSIIGETTSPSISDSGADKTEEDTMLPRESASGSKWGVYKTPSPSSTDSGECRRKPPTCWQKFVQFFGLHILVDLTFVHIMIGLSLAYTTSVSFSTFFPLFLTVDLDMTIIEASSCMTALSFTDFIGRILVPFITKHVGTTHRTTFIIGSLVLAFCRSILVLQDTYLMVLTLSAVCGIARAATVINQNLVIAEYSEEAHISSAVGLNMVSKGIFILTIGRLLGMYKDSAHNYGGCIHILNIISLTVVVSWSLEIVLKKMFKKSYRALIQRK